MDGILRCDCYEYPVVSGIALLRQISRVASIRNGAVDALKRRDSKGALLWLLENGSATEVPGLANRSSQGGGGARLARRIREMVRGSRAPLQEIPIPLQSGFKEALQATRPRGYADYLFHRFANPSLLGAIPPLMVLGEHSSQKSPGRILDLLCGVGHTSAILSALWQKIEVICADSDFVNLFLAQRFLAPRAAAVCIDAELPLPFVDSSFDGVFCLDGLHYIRSKIALLEEVNRVLGADGVWAFAHMHNASVENESSGVPLSAEGYLKRFSNGENRMLQESEILRQFQMDGGLDLTLQPPSESLALSHALTVIGSRTDFLWKMYPALDNTLCRRPDLIGFNPLYRVEEVSDGLMLKSTWPSESLRHECMRRGPILPESVHLPLHIVEEIRALRTGVTPLDEVKRLLRSFVLVSLPNRYSDQAPPSAPG